MSDNHGKQVGQGVAAMEHDELGFALSRRHFLALAGLVTVMPSLRSYAGLRQALGAADLALLQASPRFVWPSAFGLFSAPLVDAHADGRTQAVFTEVLSHLPVFPAHIPTDPASLGTPVALRWVTAVYPVHRSGTTVEYEGLGLPRQPFQVFRRSRGESPSEQLIDGAVTITGTRILTWDGGDLRPMCEVTFRAEPDPGQSLTVEALDETDQAIPWQRIQFTTDQSGRLRAPAIVKLRARGNGVIADVRGVDPFLLANLDSWEPIETVGLPFVPGEVATTVYSPQPQGFEVPSMPGDAAAQVRLEIASRLQLPVPATAFPLLPAPGWPFPAPTSFLSWLGGPKPAPLALIRTCLESSNDADPNKTQAGFIYSQEVPGLRQVGMTGSGADQATMHVPVIGVTMLAASTDGFAATGLGMGTIDFPPDAVINDSFVDPPGVVLPPFDYMVSAEFTLPEFGPFNLAALAITPPAPQSPAHLSAVTKFVDRPTTMDGPVTQTVQVTWDRTLHLGGYGIAVSHEHDPVQFLNAKRASGGFEPYVAAEPFTGDGSQPESPQVTFTHLSDPLPVSGTTESHYLAIAIDTFGRWSPWSMAPLTSEAAPVTTPGLHSVTLAPEVASASGRVVPASLMIDFSWDWEDRTPERVEFWGTFVAVTLEDEPIVPPGLALAAADTASPHATVVFDAAGTPSIGSSHAGEVTELTTDPPDSEQRTYRLTLLGLQCDFTLESDLAYAVFAAGTERIRLGDRSAYVGPRVGTVSDPLPPEMPEITADLRWTALPDAIGLARGLLHWPASPSADGYIVWEATEAALRHFVDPTLEDPTVGTSLRQRADALEALVEASDESRQRSLQAFSRLDRDLIKMPQREVILPGAANTIYAYRVSAISKGGIESKRSTKMAMFAVPMRNVPGPPQLLLRPVTTPEGHGVDVVALSGAGNHPAGYRVFRVRTATSAGDVGAMGPPVYLPDHTDWRPYELPSPNGSQSGLAIFDPVPPSWFPYYYRLVAIGREDLTNGVLAGESPASMVQQIAMPPARPPLVHPLFTGQIPGGQVFTFETDLPIRPIPMGPARIEVTRARIDSAIGRVDRDVVLSVAIHEIEERDEEPVPLGVTAPSEPVIFRGTPEEDGRVVYTVRLATPDEATSTTLIAVRDPLGRRVERELLGWM